VSFDTIHSPLRSLGADECRAIYLVVAYFSGDAKEAAKWFNTKTKVFSAKPVTLLRRKPKLFLAWCEKNLTPFNGK
jgi:hypothetical protein